MNSDETNDSAKILLIATVGGSPEPLIKSIAHHKPSRIIFLPSNDSEKLIDEIIQSLKDQGLSISGIYSKKIIDAIDFESCIEKIMFLGKYIQEWMGHRDDLYKVVVDYTCGTKCMSAALTLAASRWDCEFSYISGEERTKEGLGVVKKGTEKVIKTYNPWKATGHAALEKALYLFDRYSFQSAILELDFLLDKLKREQGDSILKRKLSSLKLFISAFDLWDSFDHAESWKIFSEFDKIYLNISDIFDKEKSYELREEIKKAIQFISKIKDVKGKPSKELIIDLLSNAKRKAENGFYDDAVARLYRALEALVQLKLFEKGFLDTGKIPFNKLPGKLKEKWSARKRNGYIECGLSMGYELLMHLEEDEGIKDGLGKKFIEAEFINNKDRRKSLLSMRNKSILAHGFDKITKKGYHSFQSKTMELMSMIGIEEKDLIRFPKLSSFGNQLK